MSKVQIEFVTPSRPGALVRSLAELLRDPQLTAPVEFVFPFLVAVGRLTLLVAREKLGKSTFARLVAAIVSSGRPYWGKQVSQGHVLWVVLEEALADVVTKLASFDPMPESVFITQPSTVNRFGQVREAVEKVKPRLVIIDTLASYAASEGYDENSSQNWTQALGQLRTLAEEHNFALLLLHHAKKTDGSYRGSTAIGAAVDQIVELHECDNSSTVREVKCMGRLDIPNYKIRFDKQLNCYHFEGEMHESTSETKEIIAKRGMREFLQSCDTAGRTEITKAAGCRLEHARRYFDAMVADGEIVAVDGMYALVPYPKAA